MNACVCSAFRNASPYVNRYFEQMSGLYNLLAQYEDTLWIIAGEGDSIDTTEMELLAHLAEFPNTGFVKVEHGGPDHGSVVNPVRFRQLAKVWNAIWRSIPANCDAVLFLEADLIWEPDDLFVLLCDLKAVPAVAPMVMHGGKDYPKEQFYDVWAFRKEGKHFNPFPPYYNGASSFMGYVPLDSAGSCIALRGDLARQVRFTEDEVIVGLCRQISSLGHRAWLNPNLYIRHP